MPEIILYQFAADLGVESGSPFCAKVHRVLAYKGLSYRPKNVGSPGEFERLNPGVGKVPVLSYDGEMVADSSRIVAFLEARHPDPALLPEDPYARALCHLLQSWADESLYWIAVYQRWAVDSNFVPFAKRAFGPLQIPLRWLVPPFARKKARAQLAGQGTGRLPEDRVRAKLEEHLGHLEALLGEQPFLTGEQLSIADISVFAPLKALSIEEATPQTAPMVRAHAGLMAWMRRVDEATSGDHTVALSGLAPAVPAQTIAPRGA